MKPPPTPVIVDTDLPIRAGTVHTTPGAAAVRTNDGSTSEPNLSVLPIDRRRVVTVCPTGVNPPALRTLRNSMVKEDAPRIRSLNGCLRRIGSGCTIEYVDMSEHPDDYACRNDFLNCCDRTYLCSCSQCCEASIVTSVGDRVLQGTTRYVPQVSKGIS